jgi:hypothetical protein
MLDLEPLLRAGLATLPKSNVPMMDATPFQRRG